jgi:hypothetical protein
VVKGAARKEEAAIIAVPTSNSAIRALALIWAHSGGLDRRPACFRAQ